MNKLNLSKKQSALIITFLALFGVSTIFMFITPFNVKRTYNLTTTTSDGVLISFNVFEPIDGGNNKKAVIMGHGVLGNKELMNSYAIEVAAAGFVAVTLDFRGHGQSTGPIGGGSLLEDIIAIKQYLNLRGDIDINNLGYVGFSMGGIGQSLVNNDLDFKCFIGTATFLYNSSSLRRGNSSNPLNVLMVVGKFDELIEVDEIKIPFAERINRPVEDVNVQKLYGSFKMGNASKIYYDDNSNHLSSYWDTDFVREVKTWVINSFPDVIQTDENFYGNIRLIILVIQIIGGIGFFLSLIKPLSEIIVPKKEKEREMHIIETPDLSIKKFSLKVLAFSLLLGVPGIFIMLIINIPLGLALFGFLVSLFFGQAFAQLLYLWRLGKRQDLSFRSVLGKPFKGDRLESLRHILLGVILASIIIIILHLSIGMNYFSFVPSLTKVLWIPVYMVLFFFTFMIFGLVYQYTLQPKFDNSNKSIAKVTLLTYMFMMIYTFVYVLVLSLIIRSFFYFGFLIPIASVVFLLATLIWTVSYRSSGNIIAGSIVSCVFISLLIGTAASLQNMIEFIFNFIN